MDSKGNIREFDSAEAALAAGFRTMLEAHEAAALKELPPSQRHAALVAMRADPTWRPSPHARRVKKSRGAKRRLPRAVRLAKARG